MESKWSIFRAQLNIFMAHKDPYDHHKELLMMANIKFLLTISLILLPAKVPNDDHHGWSNLSHIKFVQLSPPWKISLLGRFQLFQKGIQGLHLRETEN